MAHTPGPWTRKDTPDYAEIHPSSGELRQAIALVGAPDDANLIAAAPDLLDALRRIMTYAHDGAAVRDIDTSVQPEFVAARAAIQKAEGR